MFIYTCCIYAEVYIVFAVPFVGSYVSRSFCSLVRPYFHYGGSKIVVVSVPTQQKAFVFEPKLPCMVGIYSTTPDPKIPEPG